MCSQIFSTQVGPIGAEQSRHRPRMVANVGAVGALSCRVSGAEIQATQQSYALSGCQLDPGARTAKHGKIMERS